MDPKDLIFTQTLIDFYIREKKWQQAIGHFKSSLEIYPNEPVLLEGLGRLLIACPDPTLKNIPDGIEYAERAFINARSSYQTKLSAGKTLVAVYLSLGDKKNATKYINQTIKVAEEVNQSKEYIAYFKALISK
jgi:tetratricopeptide (TPR) repeat protein